MIFLFDVGGVLANSSSMQDISIELGIDKLTFKSLQKDHDGVNTYGRLLTGSISTAYYWHNFSKNFGKEIVNDYLMSCYKPVLNKALYDKVCLLNKKYRVICGTNTIESHYSVHQSLGTYDIFESVYSSHLLGVKKPDPKFFYTIIKKEDTAAENIFFIDDCLVNVNAAKSLGINAHLFKNNDQIFELLNPYL